MSYFNHSDDLSKVQAAFLVIEVQEEANIKYDISFFVRACEARAGISLESPAYIFFIVNMIHSV